MFRPIAAADLQLTQESGWSPDLTLRAGVQLEDPRIISQRLQLTLQYHNGKNPNGQFFERNLDYLGLGLHVYFF